MTENEEQGTTGLSPRIEELFGRLFRDPRYLLIGKVERFGRELLAFIEGCTLLSATGDVKGQMLLNQEYTLRGRPDGQFPYGEQSLLDYYLASRRPEARSLDDAAFTALREESWQYYVRRNFAFQLGDLIQAREDAEHNLGIWNLVEQSDLGDAAKWSYLRWWPWIERDRSIAQALWDLQEGSAEHAATELYRAHRAIEQFGQRHADSYAQEGEEGETLCSSMCQHIDALVRLLREDEGLPISLEEQIDDASARGDSDAVEQLRMEMIRRTVDEGEE